MKNSFFTIVNPAAGGGRCGQLANAVLDRVRREGFQLEIVHTSRAGEAIEFARKAYLEGARNFLAVGGDGTSYEIVNGLFPLAETHGRATLGFLPLGTGNSFLRDFTTRGIEHTIESLKKQERRACDVIRLRHADGEIYFLNLLNMGFPADVAELTNRRYKRLGEFGYILAVFMRLAALRHTAFPHRIDGVGEWDRRPCLFLTFSNSKYTGGRMMIAPKADPSDGLIEYVRWAPIGRMRLLWNFPRLFTGTHIEDTRAFRAGVKRIDLELEGPVNIAVDGEVFRLDCRSLEILPGALDIVA